MESTDISVHSSVDIDNTIHIRGGVNVSLIHIDGVVARHSIVMMEHIPHLPTVCNRLRFEIDKPPSYLLHSHTVVH